MIECRAVVGVRADGRRYVSAVRPSCPGCDGSCNLGLTTRGVDLAPESMLAAGQAIRVIVPLQALRRSAGIAFGLPLIGLLSAAITASLLGLSDGYAMLLAVAGLIVGAAIAPHLASGSSSVRLAAAGLDTDHGFVNNGAPHGAAVAPARAPAVRSLRRQPWNTIE